MADISAVQVPGLWVQLLTYEHEGRWFYSLTLKDRAGHNVNYASSSLDEVLTMGQKWIGRTPIEPPTKPRAKLVRKRKP